MKGRKVFVDTNILVYAHDKDSARKHDCAKEKVLELWHSPILPAISIQVLQELYVTLIRKDISSKVARKIVTDYLQWDIVENDSDLLLEGIKIREDYKLSFWDSLVVAAAIRAEAQILLTEDLSPNQRYRGVQIKNPF